MKSQTYNILSNTQVSTGNPSSFIFTDDSDSTLRQDVQLRCNFTLFSSASVGAVPIWFTGRILIFRPKYSMADGNQYLDAIKLNSTYPLDPTKFDILDEELFPVSYTPNSLIAHSYNRTFDLNYSGPNNKEGIFIVISAKAGNGYYLQLNGFAVYTYFNNL